MGKGEEHSIQKEQPNAKALVHEINELLVRLEWYEGWEEAGIGAGKGGLGPDYKHWMYQYGGNWISS